jgi:hypothetical protein
MMFRRLQKVGTIRVKQSLPLLQVRCLATRTLNPVPPNSKVEEYDFNTLTEMQEKTCKINKDFNFLGTKVADTFEFITFGEFADAVNKFRGVLHAHGIGVNDKVVSSSCNY